MTERDAQPAPGNGPATETQCFPPGSHGPSRSCTSKLSGWILLTGLLLAGTAAISRAQEAEVHFDWAKKMGGSNFDYGNCIATDGNGNSYVAGTFQGLGTFGNITLTSAGEDDVFIAKLDSNGNFLWAERAGGNSYDGVRAIAVDGSGNAYVTGYYSGTAVFGNTTLEGWGMSGDMFIAKLDMDGNFLWAVGAGSADGDENGNGIALDADANVYVTGSFGGDISFGNMVLTCTGSSDILIIKLDSAGNTLWATGTGGAGYDSGSGIATDPHGNAYVTGTFEDTVSFGSWTLSAPGSSDIFAAKLDSAGAFQWAVRAGGNSTVIANSIAIDAAGAAHVVGYFHGDATFGNTTLTSQGMMDAFITKLDDAGNFLWAERAGGGSGIDMARGISLDAAGDLYVVGGFEGTAMFGNIMVTGHGGTDAFITRMDQDGAFLWAVGAGGGAGDGASGVSIDADGAIHVTGSFNASASFGTVVLTSFGIRDVFTAKITETSSTVGVEEGIKGGELRVQPNPACDRIELVAQDLPSMELLITDAVGKPIVRIKPTGTSTSVDISHLASGVYLLKAYTEKGEVVKRFVKE